MYDLLNIKLLRLGVFVDMSCRKRPQIIEYMPSTPSLSTSGTITSHHTHYEPYRRPVKSTVTVEEYVVADTPLDSLSSLVAFLDDDVMEQAECKGQELEVLGFPFHCDTESSVEGAPKRRRMQAVGDRFLLKRPN